MKEVAEKYISYGINVLPVKADKTPSVASWTQYQEKMIVPNGQFDSSWGISALCGKISGGMECIDIDTKYDLTKTLFDRYKKLISDNDKNLLKKLLVEQSVSGGYHFIYRCSTTEGNQKLAKRPSTIEEQNETYQTRLAKFLSEGVAPILAESRAQKAKINDKVKGLIETRGEGGYFVCAPTPNYKIIYGSFDKINTISVEERDILLQCAITFNEWFEPVKEKRVYKENYTKSTSNPFEDYNQRADMLAFLQNEGWELISTRGSHNFLLRPGGTHKWSADYDSEKKLFYVFSDSSDFDHEKAYNHIHILNKYRFNDNGTDKEIAKYLFENGYGERKEIQKPITIESKILESNNFDFVATESETDEYIEQVRNGTFKMGLTTKFKKLDEHWRFKNGTLVVVNGHDNVGKSVLMWYLATISAIFHNWKWIIYSNENKTGGVKKKIIEFYKCKSIKSFSDSELSEAKKWFDEHFTIIKNTELFTYKDMIAIGTKLNEQKKYDAFLIDPYNSLWAETNDRHEYDYKAMTEFRQFISKTGCGIYLNCHAITEALRRKYPKEHPRYAGYPMPPDKADTEGGGKFSNKADDFLTLHRMVQHTEDWKYTEIHVKKIKEMETGGKHTFLEEPVRLQMIAGGCGFEDESGYNPILDRTAIQTALVPDRINESNEKEFNPPF